MNRSNNANQLLYGDSNINKALFVLLICSED